MTTPRETLTNSRSVISRGVEKSAFHSGELNQSFSGNPRRPRLTRDSAFALFLLFTLLLGLTAQLPGSAAQHGKPKPYALIVGTVWGPDDRPVYGVKVKIRRATDKASKVRWELFSDHMGEFAQRVPAGEADYVIWADLKGFKTADGKPLRLVQEVTVHVYSDERQDTGLHLTY